MAKNKFLAGVGRALIISNGQLISVAKTLQNSGFNFNVAAEEVRGGESNPVLGRYFHDSSLEITLTDALFDLEYIALNLGVDIQSGGITVYEGQIAPSAIIGSTVPVAKKANRVPVPFNGAYLAFWKHADETDWHSATVTLTPEDDALDATISLDGYTNTGAQICYKYFYNDANARSITINANYNPKVVSLIILNDEFSGDSDNIGSSSKVGRLVTSIPNFQFNGTNDLAFAAGSATPVSISGMANAVVDGDNCEDEPYYGTITEEIFNETWQSKVVALAIANSDITVADEVATGVATIQTYAVFGGMTASKLIDNSNCVFTVESDGGTGVTVDTAGVISVGTTTTGTAYISVTLKDANGNPSTTVAPAQVAVTVATPS